MKNEDEIRLLFSKKFEDYEVQPDSKSWDEIRLSISDDNTNLKQLFTSKIQDFEANPKDETWAKIKGNLTPNEENLKDYLTSKFENFEPQPEDSSWEFIKLNIASEDFLKLELAEKLHDFSASPSDESWDIIQENIGGNQPLKTLFSEKFANYEAVPQAQTWENINHSISAKQSLKTRLSEKFANYEAEPTAESWEIIEKAIRKDKKRRGIIIPLFYRVGIAASVALLVCAFWWLSLDKQENVSERISNKNQSQSTDNQKITSKENNQSNTASSDEFVKQNNSEKNIQELKSNSNFDLKNSNKTENFATHFNKKTDNSNKIETLPNFENKTLIEETTTASNSSPSIIDNPTLPIKMDNSQINNVLENKDFKTIAINKPLPTISLPNNDVEVIEPEQKRTRLPFTITTSLMPVQTYQAITVLPQTETYVQQISNPNAISNERLGLQAKIGLMQPLNKRNILGVNLSYTGIQQYANYELYSGDYNVQFTDSQTYTVSRVTENVNDLQYLQALGLKVENSYLLAKRKQNFYLTGGAEAMRVLGKSRNGYAVNASLGIEQKIKNQSLWLEPTFRYSLSQSYDNLNNLKIRPFQFGLNIRYNFGRS